MKLFLITVLVLTCISGYGQSEEIPLDFEVIAGSHNGEVILRWAPTNERSWLNWSNAKISIHRRNIDVNNEDNLLPITTLTDSLRPWGIDQYQKYADNTKFEDSIVMLAGFLLYGDYETTNEKMTFQNMVDRQDELANRFSSALYAADVNAKAADALAWRFVDRDNNSAAFYTLSVEWNNSKRTTKTIRFSPSKHTIPQPVLNRGKEQEGHIVLSWDQTFHKDHFTAYWIEKSKDNKEYKRLNDVPFVHAFDKKLAHEADDFIYIDSLQNYDPYHYRIIGISPFGITSEPSAPIHLQARDKTPPNTPTSVNAIMIDDQNMTITWQNSDESDDLAGFIVKKDFRYEGDYSFVSQILPKSLTVYSDPAPNYLSQNYYMVCAIDTAGNQACALPVYGYLNDTIPPTQPSGISGRIDSSGIVTLSWDHNKEIDLKGYHIYKANRQNGVFSKLTNTAHTSNAYFDTISLNTLTEDIYYSITAEDVRSNVSPHSKKIQIMKPDTIPPGPGIFKSYKSDENGIRIEWSASGSRDAVRQELWRASVTDNKLIWAGNMQTNHYLDTSIVEGILYTYSLLTFDDSNLPSTSPANVTVQGSRLIHKPIVGLSYDENSNILSYSVSNVKMIDKVVIYRSENGGPFITYKTFDERKGIASNNPRTKSSYKVIAISDTGVKSDAVIFKF